MRQTSREALKAIADKLPGKRAVAYKIVRAYPLRTAVEFEKLTGDPHLHKRLPELEQLGLVVSVEVKGHKGVLWREYDPSQDHTPPKKRTGRAATLATRIAQARSIIATSEDCPAQLATKLDTVLTGGAL